MSFLFIAPLLNPNFAHSNDTPYLILAPYELNKPLDIEPFVAHKGNSTVPMAPVQKADPYPLREKDVKYKPKGEKPMEEKIMAMIPYSKQAKYLWNVADGDIDLMGVRGLRGDRGNKGITYSTHYVPLVGEMESVEFRFDAGEDMEFIFESGHIPFAGELEGFNFKASVKEDNSRVFARYTIPFD